MYNTQRSHGYSQDKELKSTSGKTPSDYAEEDGHTDIVEFLNSFQPPRK